MSNLPRSVTWRACRTALVCFVALAALAACEAPTAGVDIAVPDDSASGTDATSTDASATDAQSIDTGSDASVDTTAADAATDSAIGPGTDASDAQNIDGGMTDTVTPDTLNPDAADTTTPDAGVLDAEFPDTVVPDSGNPDAADPDALNPDAANPDGSAADADTTTGCSGQPDGTACDDGNTCTNGDVCASGTCKGALLDCDDDNACTTDACQAGSCVHTPLGLPGPPAGCDDNNPCTLGDGCQNGTCISGEVVCECTKTADCAQFEDGNACNGKLFCNLGSGKCQIAPNSVVVCDGSADTTCSVNTCEPATGLCAPKFASDGATCSDGDACTTGDACASGVCAAGTNTCACSTDTDCEDEEDGDACNGKLFCNKSNGQCELNPATIVTCPTANDTTCSKNVCDKATGTCSMANLDGGCDDGNDCTSGEACDTGACKGGSVICECQTDNDCASKEDGNACNGKLYCDLLSHTCQVNPATVVTCPTAGNTICRQLTCQPDSGKCLWQNASDGTGCDADSNDCTAIDTCSAGLCVPDDNTCICQNSDDCLSHNDANLCNGSLYCDKSVNRCKVNPTTVVECPSGADTPCLANTCDIWSGMCSMQPIREGEPCEADGNTCTSGDVCSGGSCTLQANTCVCELDADCAKHEDGDVCNGTMYCEQSSKTCQVNPATVVTCPSVSDTDCLKNRCQPLSGTCAMQAVPDLTPCDADDNACTPNDYCNSGTCEQGLNLCACQIDEDCGEFDDGDKCNGYRYCDKNGSAPVCLLVPNSVVVCDAPSGPCSNPQCVPWTGQCEDAGKPGTACDDDNLCTASDVCLGTDCVGTANDCNDGNPCTADTCTATTGACAHSPQKPGSPCDDATSCTVGATCDNSVCQGGFANTCNDGDPCTNDSCIPGKGCTYVLSGSCAPTRTLPYANDFACGEDSLWISDTPPVASQTNDNIWRSIAATGAADGCALAAAPLGDLFNCEPGQVRSVTSPWFDATLLPGSAGLAARIAYFGTWNSGWYVWKVEAAQEGGAFVELSTLEPEMPEQTQVTFPLKTFAGKKFQLRFSFQLVGCLQVSDSGPLVDKVEVFYDGCNSDADCDDNNICTTDTCGDAPNICAHTPSSEIPTGYTCEDSFCAAMTPACVDGVASCVPSALAQDNDGQPCGDPNAGQTCIGGWCTAAAQAEVAVPPQPQKTEPNGQVTLGISLFDPGSSPLYSDIDSVSADLTQAGGSTITLNVGSVSSDGRTRVFSAKGGVGNTPGVFTVPIQVTEKDGHTWTTATWIAVLPANVVPVGPSGAFATLGNALSGSPAGSTFLIEPGTYSGAGWKNLNPTGATIIGDIWSGPVSISCNQSGRFATLNNDGAATAGLTIAGLDISQCSAGVVRQIGGALTAPALTVRLVGNHLHDNSNGNHGGALLVVGPQNTMEVDVTRLANNSVSGYRGGAFAVEDGAQAKLRWSTLTGNTSSWGSAGFGQVGGALAIHGTDSHVEVTGSTFSANSTESGSQGGYGGDAIHAAENTSIVLSESVVRDHAYSAINFASTQASVTFTRFIHNKGSATLSSSYGTLLVQDCEVTGSEGGGILAQYNTALTLKRLHLHHNLYYGSLYVSWPGTAVLQDIEVDHSSMYGTGIVYLLGELSLERLSVHHNETAGVPMYVAGNIALTDCEFRHNSNANDQGGALYAQADLTLRNCVFAHNSAQSHGGAIWHQCNPSTGTPPNSGGLLMENCLIHHNTSGGSGGALYAGATNATLPGPIVRGTTMSGNSATNGGAIWLNDGADMQLRDSIFWANTASGTGNEVALRNDATVTASIYRCLLSQLEADVADPGVTINQGNGYQTWTLGNMAGDPLFTGEGEDPFLLSQIAAGQATNSMVVDPAGGEEASLTGWGSRTTRTDGVADTGKLDYGWHAPLP